MNHKWILFVRDAKSMPNVRWIYIYEAHRNTHVYRDSMLIENYFVEFSWATMDERNVQMKNIHIKNVW